MQWGRLGGVALVAVLSIGAGATAAGADQPVGPGAPTREQVREALAHGAPVPQAHLLNSQNTSPRAGGTGGASAQAITDGLCFRNVYGDPDEPEDTLLDATSFELGFDCASSRWTFGVTTVDNFIVDDVFLDGMAFDTDNSLATGCGGFEYELDFGVDPGFGPFSALLHFNRDCTDLISITDNPVTSFDQSGNQLAIRFGGGFLKGSKAFKWQAILWHQDENDVPDFMPDTGFKAAPGNPCSGHCFFLTNGTTGGAAETVFRDPQPATQFLVGDWDGDGGDSMGFRTGNAFALKNALAPTAPDVTFNYGKATDTVLVGDWDGNGTSTLAVRRGNTYFLKNSLGGGNADITVSYGRATDTVLVGDWNGDGKDTLAVRRGNTYFLKNSFTGGPADITVSYGKATDSVLVGDWDGNGTSTLTVRRGNAYFVKNSFAGGAADVTFHFGTATDVAIVGDWNADGTDTLGVRR